MFKDTGVKVTKCLGCWRERNENFGRKVHISMVSIQCHGPATPHKFMHFGEAHRKGFKKSFRARLSLSP